MKSIKANKTNIKDDEDKNKDFGSRMKTNEKDVTSKCMHCVTHRRGRLLACVVDRHAGREAAAHRDLVCEMQEIKNHVSFLTKSHAIHAAHAAMDASKHTFHFLPFTVPKPLGCAWATLISWSDMMAKFVKCAPRLDKHSQNNGRVRLLPGLQSVSPKKAKQNRI